MLRFTDPLYLLLFVPVVAGLILSFRHVHGMARARKRLAFVVRFLLAGLLVFALAGPEARRPNHGVCTIFLLDRSDSIGDEDSRRAHDFADAAMRRLGTDDVAGVIAFGKDARVDAAPGGRRSLGPIQSEIDGSSTDLAAAIRLASASFPEGKARRIVILSDGNETSGDATEAAEAAASDGISIDHVPLGLQERRGEASVVGLDLPNEIRAEQPFDVRVTVDSSVEQNGRLDLDRDGVLVKQMPVHLAAGRSSLVVQESLKAPGFHRYRATLYAPQDHDDRNNVGMGFVAVRGKPKLLVLQGNPSQSPLADALRRSGIDVVVGGPSATPNRPEEVQGYDAIFLNDINAADLTVNQMKLLQAGVRDGGVGLAMVGGEDSFLPGGYYGTPIADALPVDLNIRQRKTFPSTSVAIMIDASGSMGMIEDGVQKLRLAGMAAERTIQLLSPTDRLGVAGSTDGIEFVVPMQKLTDKAAAIQEVQKLAVGGGGIYIEPSMAKGEQVLNGESTQVRHFILMADGDDSEQQEGALQIALRMRANKITTTVVAIGSGKDVGFLKQLAAAGGGRFYLAEHASQLPAILTQDTSLMSRSAIEEGAFLPKMSMGEEILRGIDATPPLLAYDLTDSRPLSRVGMRTQKDDPLLATWQYGLGTTLAFTSDAQARWAAHWVGWPGFATFWSQAAREISRRATRNDYQVSVRQDGGKGLLEVKAFDRLGNPLAVDDAKVRVAAPNGDSREVALSQDAPGVYTGSFDSTALGSYIVTVAEPDPQGGQRVSASGFSVPYPPEYRTTRANRPLLQRISQATGGKELARPEEALRPLADPGASITELWPAILLAAALLLPFDVGIRRLALPIGELLAKIGARLRFRRVARAPAPQAQTVARLHQAKQRAHRESPSEAPAPSEPKPEAPRKPSEPSPRPVATQGAGSTAKGLLESKRQRKEEKD